MDIINKLRIDLPDDDAFLKIRETLTRIGIANNKTRTLYQSCHILQKRGEYYIVHFKELFKLDGKPTSIDAGDFGRRNTIVGLLAQWKLLTILDPSKVAEPIAPLSQIKIIPFKDKKEWKLTTKYTIGTNKS